MTFNRRWIAFLVAGWLLGESSARAQFDGGSSDSGSSGSGASSSFGFGSGSSSGTSSSGSTPSPSSGDSSGSSGSAFGPDAGTPDGSGTTSPTTDPFSGFGPPDPTTSAPGIPGTGPTGTTGPATGVPGAASAFGPAAGELGQAPLPEAPASFSLSSAYGQAAQTFTLGEGRLARPRYRYSVTLSFGYDDNILQSPTVSEAIPEVRQEVLVDPGVPQAIFQQVPIFRTETRVVNGNFVNVQVPTGQTRLVLVEPARPPEFESVVVQPEIPPTERLGSFFARTSASFETQFASRRTVFTFDLRANADYYFDRPNDQTDLNGSISFNFIRRLTPRMQFSASANLAYLSQPDVRRINTPTRNVGEYFSTTSKFDLSYRWSPRFTTVSSISANALNYSEPAQQVSNYLETLFGTEARYLWSPRLTVLVEGRYGLTMYPNSPTLESRTAYALMGAEYRYSARLSGTVRAGLSQRTFVETGESSISPYLETTTSWRVLPTAFVTWNNRFGFEEPPDASSQVQSFRTGLSFINAFSARLRGSAGFTYISRTTTNELAESEITEQTVDANLGVEYQWSRRLSLNGVYSYTDVFSTTKVSDYYRNRIFFGLEYSF